MRLKGGMLLALAAIVLLQIVAWPQMAEFLPDSYYILPLGAIETDLSALIEAVQASDFSIAEYTGSGYDVTHPAEPPDWTFEMFLVAPRTLLIDGCRYRLRVVQENFTYTVRPGTAGQDLVITVERAMPVAQTLDEILGSLRNLAMVGADLSLEIQSFDRSRIKGPPPPAGAPIDSTLYDLMIAADWYAQANVYGLPLQGLRVEVIAEVLPGETLPEPFSAYAVGETENTVKLWIPIEQLVLLAQADEIGYVRPPYRPAVP